MLPTKAHATDAAFDLYADEDKTVPARGHTTIRTGIAMAFSPEHVLFIKDRSGLAAKEGLTTMAGVIDAGYRGEYLVVLHNTAQDDYSVKRGDRVAQAVILPLPETVLEEVTDLDDTPRGADGIGSTGR